MHDIYQFVSGPLAWIAFIVFIGGSMFRLIHIFWLIQKKESFIFSYISLKYAFRSIGNWLIPFGPVNMRNHPVVTTVTFLFHFCLIATPIFLLSHIVLWDESFSIRYWALPDAVADVMTLLVVASCLFFGIRRQKLPEVRFLTSASDYVVLSIVVMPFITGFIAYHQWGGYPFFMILHIVSGEIMLMAIPFTRLVHMLFAPFTRAYTGSEFGGVRHVKDW
ncbi:MAG: nitrate reductase [Desulfatirhabdiaceae bacterium]